MKRIFFVEDDLSLINGLTFALKKEGYETEVARTGLEAEALWGKGEYDLVILDVSLPDGSGFDLCKKFRQGSKVPIIFLTAADEETDIIMGLDIGADDYITKPFKLAVFLSRVHALLRRSDNFREQKAELVSNGITVHLLKGEGYKNGEPLELTSGEYRLLCLFMENPDVVLSAERILGRLWDSSENFIDNKTLTVYIRRLRMKIEDDPGEPKKIVTVRGMAGENEFADRREEDQTVNAGFWVFRIAAYGFLAVIALITVFNIANNISMSVSARMKQYGAMRAVGMSVAQMTRMIAAEAVTYAVCGLLLGYIAGLSLHRLFMVKLVFSHFGGSWKIPFEPLTMITVIVTLSCAAAVRAPARRIREMAITETLNEL